MFRWIISIQRWISVILWELFIRSPLVIVLPMERLPVDIWTRGFPFPFFITIVSIVEAETFKFGSLGLVLFLHFDPFRRHELWRMLTVMLVHSSPGHILSNYIAQLIRGVSLELVYGWQRISAVYMGGVLGGSLAVTFLDPHHYGCGASAGVFALHLAHLATIILNWNQVNYRRARLFWILALLAYQIGMAIYLDLILQVDSHIGHAAHFGGGLAGFIIAALVFPITEQRRWKYNFKKYLRLLSVTLLVAVLFINVACPNFYFPSEFNFNYMETFYHHQFKIIPDKRWPDFQKWCLADTDCAAIYDDYFNIKKQTDQGGSEGVNNLCDAFNFTQVIGSSRFKN